MKATTRAMSIVGAFALLMGTLTGCTPPQTVDEACSYLETEINDAAERMDDDVSAVSSSLGSRVSVMKKFFATLEPLGKGVHNREVKKSYGEHVSAINAFVPWIEAMVQDPMASASYGYSAAANRAIAAAEGLNSVCPGVATDYWG